MAIDKQGRPCIYLNNASIRYTEARIGTTLAETLPLNPSSPELKKLLPPVEGSNELMRIQVNRYTCGGLVMSSSHHHRVADVHAMSYFNTVLSKLLRGLELDSRPPYHDRSAVSVPR